MSFSGFKISELNFLWPTWQFLLMRWDSRLRRRWTEERDAEMSQEKLIRGRLGLPHSVRGAKIKRNLIIAPKQSRKYKKLSWTIKNGPVSGKTGFPHVDSLSLSFSLSLPLLFRLNSHLDRGGSRLLIALASKTHVRRSLRRGTLRYSSGPQWPNVDGANLLSWDFISSPRKPSYLASFLH